MSEFDTAAIHPASIILQPTSTAITPQHDAPTTITMLPSPSPVVVVTSTPASNVYLKKFRGLKLHVPPHLGRREMLLAFVGSFIGIAVPALLSYNLLLIQLDRSDLTLIIGSFGATAVLLYSAPQSDLSQPRNVLGGHVISALVGVIVRVVLPNDDRIIWLSAALAVSLAIVFMNITRTLHPPGGATALIAVLPSSVIQNLGFLYILIPVAAGVVPMIVVALIINNIHSQYPKFWFGTTVVRDIRSTIHHLCGYQIPKVTNN